MGIGKAKSQLTTGSRVSRILLICMVEVSRISRRHSVASRPRFELRTCSNPKHYGSTSLRSVALCNQTTGQTHRYHLLQRTIKNASEEVQNPVVEIFMSETTRKPTSELFSMDLPVSPVFPVDNAHRRKERHSLKRREC